MATLVVALSVVKEPIANMSSHGSTNQNMSTSPLNEKWRVVDRNGWPLVSQMTSKWYISVFSFIFQAETLEVECIMKLLKCDFLSLCS